MKNILITVFIFVCGFLKSQEFDWAKQLGGTTSDAANSLVVDTSGNVYTTGFFQGTADFDPGLSTYSLSSFGSGDAYISKLDKYGNFVWAKQLGGSTNDLGNTITLDKYGNVYTIGNFSGTGDFDPGPGVFNLTSAGVNDVFISKLNSNGDFVWAKRLGGASSENGNSIKIDNAGNIFTTGSFIGTVDFDPGPSVSNMVAAATSSDLFICKLDSTGNFLWAKQIGGNISDQGIDIATDNNGNNYTVGTFQQTADFNPGSGVLNVTAVGQTDGYILKLDSAGNFIWMKQISGVSDENVYTIALDKYGNIYTGGSFRGTVDFDPGPSTYSFVCNDLGDAYISKLDSNGNFMWANQYGGSNYDFCEALSLDTLGNVYATGFFSTTLDFDPGPDVYNLVSNGGNDVFINKIDPSGNFIWAKQFGSTGDDKSKSIQVTDNGSIYTTGFFLSTVDFDPGPGITSLITSSFYVDAFVHKMNYCATPSSLINPIACDSYISPSGKHTYTASGLYKDTLSNALGCDSIIDINLIINRSTTHIISPVVCNQLNSPAGNIYTLSGIYTDTISNSVGCDSIITINLTVNHSTTNTISPIACNEYNSPNGNLYTLSGVYSDTISNTAGCDSIITINLTVNHTTTNTISPIVCNEYNSPNGNIYTLSGIYTDTTTNSVGCDSIITINLTINTVDTSTNITMLPLLLANAIGATFQWLDCNNGFTTLSGETNASFDPIANGYYAVEVSQNNCVDTSLCYIVNIISINTANFLSKVIVYPNPTQKTVKIDLDKVYTTIEVVVKNNLSEEVIRKTIKGEKQLVLEMDVPDGIYFIHLKTDFNEQVVFKVIKTESK